MTLGYLGKTIMSKMADVKAAVDQLGTEIMSEFDAFDSKIEAKLQELVAAQTASQGSGDSAEVDSVLQSIEQIRSDFRAKVQGKTDALTPQVVASAGVSDSVPAAPAQDTIASGDVDTIEAGQNPRLGGTVQETAPQDSVTHSDQDTFPGFGSNTVDASESVPGVEPVKAEDSI